MRRPGPILTATLDAAYVAGGIAAGLVGLLRGRAAHLRDHLTRRGIAAPPAREGDAPCVWIHGVSVGEVTAASSLVDRLAAQRPDLDVVVSSSTRLGFEAARQRHPDRVVISAPLDIGALVRRSLLRIRPDLIVIVEHDLWPNFLRHARAAEIPVAVVNARMSARSFRGYRRLSRVFPWPPRDLAAVCVQDEESRERFVRLGFPAERLELTGNLKFDTPPPDGTEGVREELGYAPQDWILVAASTHEGEEEAVLDVLVRLRRLDPSARLIVAPRRIERADRVAERIRARGLSLRRRSEPAGSVGSTELPDVLLLDTLGELARICAAGSAVFVGGSLVDVGGHSVIEPASLGRAVLIGPHHQNTRSVVRDFLERDAILVVDGTEQLADAVLELRRDPARTRRLGANAARAVAESLGAVERTLERLVPLLPPA